MRRNRPIVLVVEDHPDNRYLATLLLESEGFEVVAVGDGVEALRYVELNHVDLVLLDLQLPDCDGFDVARALRTRFAPETLPIIAVSALARSSDRRHAFAAGCTGYIEKPIDADAFAAQVRCQAGLELA